MIDQTWLSFRSVHENVDFDGFVNETALLCCCMNIEETRNLKTCPTFEFYIIVKKIRIIPKF